MDWMEIVSALTLIAFIIVIYPATREMMKNSPRGTSSDWMGFVVPVVIIVLFIVFLDSIVTRCD